MAQKREQSMMPVPPSTWADDRPVSIFKAANKVVVP
jgi:hypothetical protein